MRLVPWSWNGMYTSLLFRVAHLLVLQGAWVWLRLRVFGRQRGSAHRNHRHAHRLPHALQQRRRRGHLQNYQSSAIIQPACTHMCRHLFQDTWSRLARSL